MKRQIRRRNQRVNDHLQLVSPIARHYANRCGVECDDLNQVGLMGLLRAAENFNADRCVPFHAFARPHIRGAILHYLRDNASMVRMPRRWQESKENEEGAKNSGAPLRRVYCCAEAVADPNHELTVAIEQIERSKLVQTTLSGLGGPERTAIEEVVLHGLSLRAAGKASGVSAMTMQRRVKRGLEQLRSALEPQLCAD